MKSNGHLERLLESGTFAVTAELGPPMSADSSSIAEKAKLLDGVCDAVNITDNQTAVARMSSVAASALCLQAGLEPVMQMVCRDRNRIAMQSDLLGASALGIRNCLCLSGDHQSFGRAGKRRGHPQAKNVYDIDSINLVATLKRMRDDRSFLGGDPLKGDLPLLIGAAWTPSAHPVEFRVVRLAKKIRAGADFIQTQGVYDVDRFAEVMSKVRNQGLHEKTHILPGVIAPKSAGMLKYMNKNVAGVEVPDSLIKRMEQASNPKAEGIRVTAELINDLKAVEGVRGVHVQAIEWETAVADIVRHGGLLPRPKAA